MNYYEYKKHLIEQLSVDKVSVKKKIMDFFKNNPNPTDKDIHGFASSLNINEHKFEEIIYEILSSILSYGKSTDFNGSYDPKQIAMGIKVEMEHTNYKLIAEKIAKDHLAEISDYYTRLDKMEKEAGVEH